jgi:small acid-soluble spore protein I (minor)
MNIDIRDYIKNNFKGTTTDDIKESIEESIKKGDEIVLPGLGVLFETLWNASDEECQTKMINMLQAQFQ